MPVRNCAKTVAIAVRSILRQSFQDWELLILDDGSTDATLKELTRFRDSRVKVFQDGERKGLPARLNQAIGIAQGEFYARMDGDDVCYPKRFELQLEYLRSHPEVDLVGGGVLVFRGHGEVLGKRIPPEAHAAICRRPTGGFPVAGFPLAHPTFFGKSRWFRCHGYNETALLCQDQDLLLRAFESSSYANVPAIVLGYRDELKLGKLLRSRRFLARLMLAEHLRKGRPMTGVCGVLLQYLKGAIDITAMLTGLQYQLLRHRARPVTGAEIAQWHQVWQSANQTH